MKYICVKINMSQSMDFYKYISKLRLYVECCNDFFGDEWYWYALTKFRTI
jgi:hypothetical protein